ncbi:MULTISPECIES: hypothetical protein [unclassified Methanoregula]|uniref:hypothetical protein n=1 Tax=unclassified Methanoregula TaxID=2649730 RepID=UPI0009D2BB8D|nr:MULTISPECIES: hypothetical protein [unclassified Methanoregula]OPX63801.1 MAG: hypothetical protein A4E33_01501 [Methanoregula sp. PtaB.Bin085]OPY36658.1 MAG: hypothetical protein A4E34_00183 [Methanoregula sp. PtaU1.Bin006]
MSYAFRQSCGKTSRCLFSFDADTDVFDNYSRYEIVHNRTTASSRAPAGYPGTRQECRC